MSQRNAYAVLEASLEADIEEFSENWDASPLLGFLGYPSVKAATVLYLFVRSVKGEGDPEPLVEALRKLNLDSSEPVEEVGEGE